MDPGIDIEYVGADLSDVDPDLFSQFKGIFDKFTRPEELVSVDNVIDTTTDDDANSTEVEKQVTNEEPAQLSKKKKKLLSRLSVAQLKQLVPRPDVVEAHDTTSHDPRLLVYLKSYRNSVQVPRHWCSKRTYLAGKRGIERPPFQLPDFIAETGIAKIRESVLEQEALKKNSQKARDKMQPKMGRIDIDYQVLHDAFFKYQSKPQMTKHGDIYYEGKEFEIDLKEKKPGVYSPELIEALGMTDDHPTPWLINMQRYGPPPAYPNLRIPGLNAPIPSGCEYGYQPGGWGKPPVDEYGRPIYGDVFGLLLNKEQEERQIVVDKDFRWGEAVAIDQEYEEEEEEDSDDEYSGVRGESGVSGDTSGLETPSTIDGMSSVSTVATGLETPDGTFDLRKRIASGVETPLDEIEMHKDLYHVVKEKQGRVGGGALFGSDKGYVLPGKSDVQLSVNPEEAEDADKLQQLYDDEHSSRSNENESAGVDDSLEQDPRNKRKRRTEAAVNAKRHRDFKF